MPDAKIEVDETVVLTVDSSSASGKILDDDNRSLKVTISEESVAEGSSLSTYVPFTVERVGGSTKVPLDVDLLTFGVADNYIDYAASRVPTASEQAFDMFVLIVDGPLFAASFANGFTLNGQITFDVGVSIWNGFIRVRDDLEIEPTETMGIKARPSNANEAVVNGSSQDSMTIGDNDLDQYGTPWVAISVPLPTADSYLSITMDDLTQKQWVFNSQTNEWERVKKVYGWKALDSEVVPLTNPGEATFLNGATWSGSVTHSESGTIQLGGTLGYILNVEANAQASLSQELGLSIGGPWDPNAVIHSIPNVRWGGVRLIQTIQFVKQFKQGTANASPVDGIDGENEVTRENLLTVQGALNGILFYNTNTSAIIFNDAQP